MFGRTLKVLVAVVALAHPTSACLFEPTDRVAGQWGGSGISLDARYPVVQLKSLPCVQAVSPELSLDATGHFEGTAQVTSGRLWSVHITSVHMSGDVEGGTMMLAMTYMSLGGSPAPEHDRYVLRRSGASDFSDWICPK